MLSTPFSRHTYLHTYLHILPCLHTIYMHDAWYGVNFVLSACCSQKFVDDRSDILHLAYCLLRIFTLYHISVLAPKKAAEKKLEEEVNEEQTLALTRVHHGNQAIVSGVLMAALSCGCRMTIINRICLTVVQYPLLIGGEVFQYAKHGMFNESRFNEERLNVVVRTHDIGCCFFIVDVVIIEVL